MKRALAPLALLPWLAACATGIGKPPTAPVEVGVIAINDFHGAIEPPNQSVVAPDGKGGTVQVPAGGGAYLAAAVSQIRTGHPNSVTVAAGDLIGASQLASALFLDEPAIGVLDRIGLDYAAVGNHEFDRGTGEIVRIQKGGCEKFTQREPCAVEPDYAGAQFQYLAANVFRADGSTLFPATAIEYFGQGENRVSVGIVGLTLKGTPALVSPGGIGDLTFGDEAQAINDATADLKARGADAIVVLIHQGIRTSGQDPDPDGCTDAAGELLPILDMLDSRVDVVVSGHTHWAYVCELPEGGGGTLLLTSAGVYGKLVTDITLEIDPVSGSVTSKRARNVVVQSEEYQVGDRRFLTSDLLPRLSPDSEVAAYVARYAEAAEDFTARPAGRIAGPIERSGDEAELGGPLAKLIADAQLGATREAGAQVSFMNPFGVRADLSPGTDGNVTYGDIYRVQPFNNTLVTQTLTGRQLMALLEQQFDDASPQQVLAASAGFYQEFDLSRPDGQRVLKAELEGKPIDPDAEYRVTANSFLAGGGDFFTVLAEGRDGVIGMNDLDALELWLREDPPRTAPMDRRARDVTP